MPGVWVVLIPVAPLPAAVCPGKLRTPEHAGLLTSLGERDNQRILCHLPNPLRRCRLCAWPGGPSVEAHRQRDAVAQAAYALHDMSPSGQGRTRAHAGTDCGSKQPTPRSEEERPSRTGWKSAWRQMPACCEVATAQARSSRSGASRSVHRPIGLRPRFTMRDPVSSLARALSDARDDRGSPRTRRRHRGQWPDRSPAPAGPARPPGPCAWPGDRRWNAAAANRDQQRRPAG